MRSYIGIPNGYTKLTGGKISTPKGEK